jgi:hypothetical protein
MARTNWWYGLSVLSLWWKRQFLFKKTITITAQQACIPLGSEAIQALIGERSTLLMSATTPYSKIAVELIEMHKNWSKHLR